MILPNFFMVGQPKSGTSSLHLLLNQHPDIFMSQEKEPLFFCKDFLQEAKNRSMDYNFKYKNENDYLKLFSEACNFKIRGESSTHYLFSTVAAHEIYQFNPDAYILIILRNPVTFLPSYHSQLFASAKETEQSFQKALSLEPIRRTGKSIPNAIWAPSFLFYTERVKYAEQIQRYFHKFTRNKIKILIYEDFQDDNVNTFRSVLEFLEINSNVEPQILQVNMNKSPRNHTINRLFFNPFFRRALQFFIPEKVRSNQRVENFFKRCLWKHTEREPLPQEFVEYLYRLFLPEVERLSDLLQIDLVQKWGFDMFL